MTGTGALEHKDGRSSGSGPGEGISRHLPPQRSDDDIKLASKLLDRMGCVFKHCTHRLNGRARKLGRAESRPLAEQLVLIWLL